jgi:hypothetical protein
MAKKTYIGPYDLKGKFVMVWWEALRRLDIRPQEALFLCLVDGLSRYHGVCYASRDLIGYIMNISAQTVFAMQKKLVKQGLLEVRAVPGLSPACLVTIGAWRKFVKEQDAISKRLSKSFSATPKVFEDDPKTSLL